MQADGWHSEYDCFLAMFPVSYFSSCLAWTNGSLPSTLDHFTEYEHWQCIGVLLGTSLAYGCNIRELWGTKDDGFCPPFNLGSRFNLARDRYLSWKRYLKLWPPDHSDNPWYMAHSLIHAFNQRRREVVEPGTECIIDESMGMWKPFFENTPEGIPSLRKIARKPQGIGIEYKNLADAETGIILHLEIQEAADIMAKKAYCDRYPKSVALVLRLTEMLHGSGRVIHGDSAFASVACCTALLEHGLYFSGLLKTAHKEFPKKYCQDIAFQAGAQRGDTVTICTTKAIGSATKFIYGHVWNEPGSEGTPKKIIVSTWNHTLPVDDHIKKRWRLNPVSGESETIMRTVPRTQMIKSYFSAACAIDVHNHLRQDGLGLEHSVQTKDWWFRMFCTILGIIEVDAFKVFCSFNVHTKQPPHSVFTENLVNKAD